VGDPDEQHDVGGADHVPAVLDLRVGGEHLAVGPPVGLAAGDEDQRGDAQAHPGVVGDDRVALDDAVVGEPLDPVVGGGPGDVGEGGDLGDAGPGVLGQRGDDHLVGRV